MVNIIRRFQQPLMIAITVIVIIAFAWLYNDTRYSGNGGGVSSKVASIYGKPVSFAQYQKFARKSDAARELGMQELYQLLAGNDPRDTANNFLWNDFVVRHESKELNIEPSNEEVLNAIKGMMIFQANGAFDPQRYQMIVERALTPRGFTADDLEDLVRDELRVQRIRSVLGSTVAPSNDELRTVYARQAQKTEASVVRLKLDTFLAAVQVSEDDVKKLYEERKATLKTDEQRKAKYVAFILATTDKPLDLKQRSEELSKLSKKAEDFSVAMTEKGAKLEDVAQKFGVKVEETAAFAEAKPPAEIAGAREAAATVFKLTEKDPVSDIVTGDRGYYVFQLDGITVPRPLTLDEAKASLTDSIKQDRAKEALNLKATEIRNKIDADLKAGKSFADAATAAGAKAEAFPTFSRQDYKDAVTAPNSGEIMDAASGLGEGELSKVEPASDGSLIVYVGKRLPIDEAKFTEEKPKIVESFAQMQSAALFQEWLKLRRATAQLDTMQRGN